MSKRVVDYPGGEIGVRWEGRLCIHIGECGRATGPLFEAGRIPWCDPSAVDVDHAMEVCRRCPTGALTWQGGEPEQAEPANAITVANNGPLYVRGDLNIAGVPDDMTGVRTRAALCRCGASKNKPFCDNSHETEGFVDRGAIGQTGPGLADDAAGPLTVQSIPDGPLLLAGPVSLVTASGRVAWKGTKCALCRCGASKNKPFCDGAHRTAGFKS